MDPTNEIKARLTIEDLVGQYCQLQKKGRNFVALCPFHSDSHPSLLVSPDKGIAYCFACQTGGDIFSFYQAIEGVDFRQALKDLAEKAGVKLETNIGTSVNKDEKERLRDCLVAAQSFYREQLQKVPVSNEYLKKRGIPKEQIDQFELGFAPDSFSATYDHLLKQGFSRSEIVNAGMGIQRELKEEKIYDRFRNRVMFPIHDHQGKLVAFGGRTLGDTDAKYINSAESPLYHKSAILFGMHHAKEAMRERKSVILVEGYFDVLAAHRVGAGNVVAASGTALTQQHAKLLKRYVDKIVLCLDQDRAGRDAAERAYHVCMAEELPVNVVVLPNKDPDETAASSPELLKQLLTDEGIPYVDLVLQEVRESDVTSATGKREALQRVLPLIQSMTSAVERGHYLAALAAALGTTEMALKEDLAHLPLQSSSVPVSESKKPAQKEVAPTSFSRFEVALGLFLLYPQHLQILRELIEPTDGFIAALYGALKEAPESDVLTVEMLDLEVEQAERASVLQLYCEHHGFTMWSEGMAVREIRKNCRLANRDFLQQKQKEISKKLLDARLSGKSGEEAQLNIQYQELLKLARMAQ